MESYIPKDVAKILSTLTGRKMGNRIYYDMLREFRIINNNNILLPPFIETGDWYYDNEHYIQPKQKLVAIHRKVLTTR